VDGKDEIKFVLSTRRDYEFRREFTREYGLATRVKQFCFHRRLPIPKGSGQDWSRANWWSGFWRTVAGAAGIAVAQIYLAIRDAGV